MKSQTVLCGLLLAVAPLARATYTPVAIQSSSYNADVIVESNATPRLVVVTTATVDNGTNNTANTLFEVGYDPKNPNNGVPVHGTTISAADATTVSHSFTMPPDYTQPNGILVDTTSGGTFTFTTPAAYKALSFMGLGGNGGDSITVTIHHQDGTSETQTFGCPDWFGGSGVAYIMGGRCNNTLNLTTETDGTSGDSRGNPRIYYRDITLTGTTSPVTSVDLAYLSGASNSHNDIMAVAGALTSGSGAFTPIIVTGYTYDFIVEATAPMDGRIFSQVMDNGTNELATTESLDATNNTGNSWYEQGYNINDGQPGSYVSPTLNFTATGIPHPSQLITNSTGDHIYQMPPDYTVNNAVYISSFVTNAMITLTTPTAYSGLSFLGSAGSGPVPVFCIITHSTGVSETNILSISDWYSSSATPVWDANGRVAVDTAQFSSVASGNPQLFENDVRLTDTTDPITTITLINTNNSGGGRFAILALSGAAGALPPSPAIEPASLSAYQGSSVTFTSTATANVTVTYQWQIATNGTNFVNLANGNEFSGATSSILTINPVGFNDQASFRMVSTDSAGYADSSAATLTVFSANADVTSPNDTISVSANVSPFGDGAPIKAIDNDMSTKFGANFTSGTIPALIETPAAGRTVVSALRIYTGSDSQNRDPASFELFGSLNGGASYTLITSNSITLTANRNSGDSGAPNPLTEYCTEVRFNNTNAYTTYKLAVPTQQGGAGNTQIQFEEMELLGVVNTTGIFFSQEPSDARTFEYSTATFTAVASANTTPTVFWMRGTNGTYVALTDNSDISGSQTTTLSVNNALFSDAVDYIAVASSSGSYVTSSIAHLYVFSTNTDVTVPGDPIVGFGDITGTRYSANPPSEAIDDDMIEYQNGGSGLNASAGFPPFVGPVGLIVTPAVGSTVLAGLRVYPGADSAANDPSSYILEGSDDSGTNYATFSWSTISSGPLSLPAARNDVNSSADPTAVNSVQEILFSNTRAFTTYRLTFPNVVSPNVASYLEVGEIELLGVPGVGSAQPVVSKVSLSNGSLLITGTGGLASGTYTVQTNANLSVSSGWATAKTGTYDASGNFSITLPVNASTPQLFYRVK
jgi:hypothetical protein